MEKDSNVGLAGGLEIRLGRLTGAGLEESLELGLLALELGTLQFGLRGIITGHFIGHRPRAHWTPWLEALLCLV